MRGGVHTMWLARLFLRMWLVAKLSVTKLFTQFPVYNLPILNCGYDVEPGAAKVLADGLPIVSNRSNLSFRNFLIWNGCLFFLSEDDN
jgi:hypothetical protein